MVDVVLRDRHTDIGLPMAGLHGPLASLQQNFPGASHLLFGFGERAYWTKPDPTLFDMLRALLPGPGAILVTGLRVSPADAFEKEDVVTIGVSRAGLDRLTAFLWGELQKEPDGLPHPMADGPYLGSLFYPTRRIYSALYTCNTWTAEAMQVAGLPVTASGVLFAGEVMMQARRAASDEEHGPTLAIIR